MLLQRGIALKLAFLVAFVKGQTYDSEYRSDYDGGDDHSGYNEGGSDGPDYSKYYANEGSSPIIASKADAPTDSGFVSPLDFSGFFGAPSHFEFGAASNQEPTKSNQQSNGFVSPHELQSGISGFKTQAPFGGKDYFEQAQQKQKNPNTDADYELKPGPSYVSHKIVPPSQKTSEVSDLNQHYKYNPYKTVKSTSEDDDDDEKESYEEKTVPKYDFTKYDALQQYPVPKPTVVDPKYLPQQYTPKNPQTITPYQKFSFQPGVGESGFKPYTPALQNIKYTTVIPNYEYSPSEHVSKLVKHKNCQKVYKQPIGDKQMDCYSCKNPKTGANYEECSYGAESSPKNYYVASSKKYSSPSSVDSYRYKRYTVNDDKDDPYEYIKSQSQKYYSKPKDFDKTYNYDKDAYRFGPEYFDDEGKSASEKQSEELVKSGENCKKVHTKDNMVCMVCKSKSGGNYEQCSYSSQPKEKKYAYVKERKYDSEDEPDEEETDSSEDKPIKQEEEYGQKRKGEKGNNRPEEVERVKPLNTNRQRSSETRKYDVPHHFEESNAQNQDDSYEEEKPLESRHKDDYYYKFFPDYNKQESTQSEQTAEPENYGYYGEGDKKDVEEVLAEFAKKDRSSCKKAEKNGMTCYLCTDKKGQQHEECMYVSESRPQSKYQAYHAKQETDEPKIEQSEIKPTEVPSPKQRRFPKKSDLLKKPVSTPTAPLAEPSTSTTTPSPSIKTKRQYRRTKNIAAPSSTTQSAPISEDGEYADETKPVYSKVLGFSLPKYMLTKSEGERNYDEFVGRKS